MKTSTIEYCNSCKRDTIHYGEKHKFSWVLHFIMFILTGFIWVIPFIFYYMAKKDKVYNLRCASCVERRNDENER